MYGIIAIEATVEILVESKFFMSLRAWLSKVSPGFFGKLFSCGYCMSVWCGALGLIMPGSPIGMFWDHPSAVFIDAIIRVLVAHRLSNVWHELLQRWFDRQMISIVFHHHKAGTTQSMDPVVEFPDDDQV
jgi:hypothetical protein